MGEKISLVDRLKFLLTQPHYPEVGIEFNSDSIRLATVSIESGSIKIENLDSEQLPPGAIEPNPFKPNIHSMEVVAEKLKSLWTRNRVNSPKVCLLLQDRCALTFQLNLEHPTDSRQECLDWIRFKLKKSVPFRIEEAQISFFSPSGVSDSAGQNLWTIVLNHSVLTQYEEFIRSTVEAECGLVDLATFNLMNFTYPEIKGAGLKDQDVLFVNLNRDYISMAISQKGNLMFYRSRALERQNGMIEEALAEIYPATMFYVDKLEGKGIARAFVYSVENPADLSKRIQSVLNLPAAVVSPERVLRIPLGTKIPAAIDTYAPLLGLIVSRRIEFQ